MHLLAEGEQVEPLLFRNEDFCQEMALDFNRILERYNNTADNQSGDQAFFDAEQEENSQPVVSGTRS
jgi:hypothetical protein